MGVALPECIFFRQTYYSILLWCCLFGLVFVSKLGQDSRISSSWKVRVQVVHSRKVINTPDTAPLCQISVNFSRFLRRQITMGTALSHPYIVFPCTNHILSLYPAWHVTIGKRCLEELLHPSSSPSSFYAPSALQIDLNHHLNLISLWILLWLRLELPKPLPRQRRRVHACRHLKTFCWSIFRTAQKLGHFWKWSVNKSKKKKNVDLSH